MAREEPEPGAALAHPGPTVPAAAAILLSKAATEAGEAWATAAALASSEPGFWPSGTPTV